MNNNFSYLFYKYIKLEGNCLRVISHQNIRAKFRHYFNKKFELFDF